MPRHISFPAAAASEPVQDVIAAAPTVSPDEEAQTAFVADHAARRMVVKFAEPVPPAVEHKPAPVADAPTADEAIGWHSPGNVKRFTLAGRAEIVLTRPATGQRVTFRVKRASDTSTCPGAYYVDIDPRVALGQIGTNGAFVARRLTNATTKAAAALFDDWWSNVGHGGDAPGIEATHVGKCGRCHRELTDPVSVEAGIGPECHLAVFGKPRKSSKKTGRVRRAARAVAEAPVVEDDAAFVPFTVPAPVPEVTVSQPLLHLLLDLAEWTSKHNRAVSDMHKERAAMYASPMETTCKAFAAAEPGIAQAWALHRSCKWLADTAAALSPRGRGWQASGDREEVRKKVLVYQTGASLAWNLIRKLERQQLSPASEHAV